MFSNTVVSLFLFLEAISQVEPVIDWISESRRYWDLSPPHSRLSIIYLWSTSCTFLIPASSCGPGLTGHKPMTRVRWAQTSSHFSFLSCDHLTKISHGCIFTSVQFSIIKRSRKIEPPRFLQNLNSWILLEHKSPPPMTYYFSQRDFIWDIKHFSLLLSSPLSRQ